jgi:hypothetical protein
MTEPKELPNNEETTAAQSYFEQRMQALGITPEINQVRLLKYDAEEKKNILKPEPVFRKHELGIEIIVYTLDRCTIRIEKSEGSKQRKDWSIIRYEKPVLKNGKEMKYRMPSGQGSFPFFPPQLLDKFDERQQIDTLFITEGFFKAFKGAMHGIDIIGLPSITHMKNKDTGALHPDILKLMHACGVKRMVWLTDGDCLDLSSKILAVYTDREKAAGIDKKELDLSKRPYSFYSSVQTFKQLLDDYADVEKYFLHIDTDAIVEAHKVDRGTVKGLDDLLQAFPTKIEEITADLKSVSKNGDWFQKYNITSKISKAWSHFRLNSVLDFYLFHSERTPVIKGKEFMYFGTSYLYNDTKNECEVVVPGDASNYCRVGNDYYKFIQKPNKYGNQERSLEPRLKSTIVDDHGKKFIDYVPKYETFCNVPHHINYQPVIHNCFNLYSPLDYTPQEEEAGEEDCKTILQFMQHIFGTSEIQFNHPKLKEKKKYTMLELGLDYVQLLYHRPWEKLPILCLVSKENNTGKSTYGKLLKQIFGGNCAVVGNQDLAGDFNKHWSTKTIVICDETKIDKQHVIEKVKSLSTADKIMMNAKGKDHVEIDCFIKFIFITNNEDNFIYASEDDIRYWIIKVPTIKEENPGMLENMVEEIPAFLQYLNKRKLVTDKLNRMWFHPSLLKTEALKKVIEYSRPTIQKELLQKIRDVFFDFGVKKFMMTKGDILQEFFRNSARYESNYLAKVLTENMQVDLWHKLDHTQKDLYDQPKKIYGTTRYTFPRWEENAVDKTTKRVEVSRVGRPYVFEIEKFLTPEEIAQLEPGEENKYINGQDDNNADQSAPTDDLPF